MCDVINEVMEHKGKYLCQEETKYRQETAVSAALHSHLDIKDKEMRDKEMRLRIVNDDAITGGKYAL